MRISALYLCIRDASFSEALLADTPIMHPQVVTQDQLQPEANQ